MIDGVVKLAQIQPPQSDLLPQQFSALSIHYSSQTTRLYQPCEADDHHHVHFWQQVMCSYTQLRNRRRNRVLMRPFRAHLSCLFKSYDRCKEKAKECYWISSTSLHIHKLTSQFVIVVYCNWKESSQELLCQGYDNLKEGFEDPVNTQQHRPVDLICGEHICLFLRWKPQHRAYSFWLWNINVFL